MLRLGTALLLLIVNAAATAQQAREDAWWTGPMLAPNGATLPHGHVLIEPYLFDIIQTGASCAGGSISRTRSPLP